MLPSEKNLQLQKLFTLNSSIIHRFSLVLEEKKINVLLDLPWGGILYYIKRLK